MKKKRIKKKGQAEDFLADLIPSLIIIVIGLFVLSKMHAEEQKLVDERAAQLESILKQEIKPINYHLSNEKVEVDGREISLRELISLSYKNNAYQGKLIEALERKGLVQQDKPVEAIAETVPQEQAEAIQKGVERCLKLKIEYPDSSTLEAGEKCEGIETILNLPTYEGPYLIINATVGLATV